MASNNKYTRSSPTQATLLEVNELLATNNLSEALDLLLSRSTAVAIRERIERLQKEYIQIRFQILSSELGSLAQNKEMTSLLEAEIRAIAQEIDIPPTRTRVQKESETSEFPIGLEDRSVEHDFVDKGDDGPESLVHLPSAPSSENQAPTKQANRLLAKEQQAQAQLMAKLSATEKYPKHLLALEGEGPHALGTLAALLALEQALRRQSGRSDYHLCQTFELVGGTGLSAFFATAIALGHPMPDFQSVFIDKITLLYSNPRSDTKAVLDFLLNFFEEYFGKTTLAEANWQSGICYFLRRYESGQPLLIDNHPDGKSYPDNGALTLAELLLAAGNPFSTSAVQLDYPSGPVRVVDISNGLFRNPELLLFYQATSADGPFPWPTYVNDLRLCSIGTQLDPDIPNPAMQQNMASQSAPAPEAIAPTRSPLGAAQYQHQRLSHWLLEGESLAGSHTDIRPVLGANPALLSRIALPPVPESRLLDWEYLRAQADRALESADLSAFLPKLQAQ